MDQGDQLYNEYQQKNLNRAPQQKKNRNQYFVCFSNSNQYIDQLFHLLNCNNQQLNTKIWSILQMIPSNQEVYQLIEQSQNDWSKLLVVGNKYRLQYHLQILREQLSCDCVEDEDNYRILRYNFIFEMHNNYSLYPVYKRSNTRKRAFDLLLELSKVQMHLYQILDLIQINQQTRTSSQELNSEFGIKREHGFVCLYIEMVCCYKVLENSKFYY
ncbi:unnamed protein product (macronuclear) [Paramecium tetraurelia]|uniref:Uncharacterized protein n=1 Tax=Paramecium tetraurelia TaxID=5888 RepID=A0BJM2_PARTE|nr:uncharacterized protein GSPATT00029367001 [Paramecium tetraurelia]CAK58739.1 unnamed protein product [Paramecium tetraurelia]|eukprot:XP_001426137.1 hypothetical protein (macronuclear) [Paramecium tetraurelia strain d4-2]